MSTSDANGLIVTKQFIFLNILYKGYIKSTIGFFKPSFSLCYYGRPAEFIDIYLLVWW